MKSNQQQRSNFEIVSDNGLFKVKSLKYGYEDVGYFFEITYIQELLEVGAWCLVAKECDGTYTIFLVEYFDNQGKPKKIKIHKAITDIEEYIYCSDSILAIYMRGYFMFIAPGNFGVAPGMTSVHTKEIIDRRVLDLEKIPGEKISYESQFNNLHGGKFVFKIDDVYYLIENKSFVLLEEHQVDITRLGYAEPMEPYNCILVKDDEDDWYIYEGCSKKFNVDYMKAKEILPYTLKEMKKMQDIFEEKNVRAYKFLTEEGIVGISLYDADTQTFPAKFYQISLKEPAIALEFRKRLRMSEESGDYIDFWNIHYASGRMDVLVKNSRGTKCFNAEEII